MAFYERKQTLCNTAGTLLWHFDPYQRLDLSKEGALDCISAELVQGKVDLSLWSTFRDSFFLFLSFFLPRVLGFTTSCVIPLLSYSLSSLLRATPLYREPEGISSIIYDFPCTFVYMSAIRKKKQPNRCTNVLAIRSAKTNSVPIAQYWRQSCTQASGGSERRGSFI